MPSADFNTDINIPGQNTRSQFVRLTQDGQKIKFRIAKAPFYLGKHWIGERDVVPCLTVNANQKCEWCDKFEQGVKNPSHRSGTYKPTVEFYYPIVNRDTQQAEIFQTSISIHSVIREASKEGIDVYKSDWVVKRKGGDVPANFYSTVRLDATELTEEEEKEMEKAKEIDFEKIFSGKGKSSSMEILHDEEINRKWNDEKKESEATGEKEPEDEIPF